MKQNDAIFFVDGCGASLQLYGQQKNLKTGEVVGLEVLLRTINADTTTMQVVEQVEGNGDMHTLSLAVLTRSCKAMRACDNVVPLAVNIPAYIIDDSFIVAVTDILAAHHTDPTRLIFEITERSPIEKKQYEGMRTLSSLGIRFALDDFGTGYANMEVLDATRTHDVHMYEVKLDRCYLKDTKALNMLACDLMARGYTVTVEGVEKKSDLDALPDGVQVQGFFFSVPQPIADVLCSRYKQNVV